jgi:hypothetical protein
MALFDAKFGKPQRYRYSGGTDFLIFSLPTRPQYVAIIPGRSIQVNYERMCWIGPKGNRERDSNVSTTYLEPFLVHFDHLEAALRSTVDALRPGSSGCYENPTTGLRCEHLEQSPHVNFSCLQTPPTTLGNKEFRQFYDAVASSGRAEIRQNPFQPLICDCFIDLKDVDTPLRIEFKKRTATGDGWFSGDFRGQIFWHFAVIALNGEDKWACISRHQLDAEEIPKFRFKESSAAARGIQIHTTIGDILDFMQRAAAQAITAGDQLPLWKAPEEDEKGHEICGPGERIEASRHEGHEFDDSDYSLSDAEAEALALEYGFSDATGGKRTILQINRATDGKKRHVRRQEGIAPVVKAFCQEFNAVCADRLSLVAIPLSPNHPRGNCVIVDHAWSQDEVKAYFASLDPPLYLSTPGLKDRSCCPVALSIFRPQALGAQAGGKLRLYSHQWEPLATSVPHKPYITIATLLSKQLLGLSKSPLPWMVCPSGYLQAVHEGHRQASVLKLRPVKDGVDLSERVGPLTQIHRLLLQLIRPGDANAVPDSPLPPISDPGGDPRVYRARLSELHQDFWDLERATAAHADGEPKTAEPSKSSAVQAAPVPEEL